MCTSTWHGASRHTWPGLAPTPRSLPHVLTFSPVRVTMSRGPYMNRPVTTCGPSSLATASLIRWLAVTFWRREWGQVRVGGGSCILPGVASGCLALGKDITRGCGSQPQTPAELWLLLQTRASPGLRVAPALTRSFTCVRLRCHFSLGCEGVNTDTSLPSRSRMLALSCLMTWG